MITASVFEKLGQGTTPVLHISVGNYAFCRISCVKGEV
ncbi:hypothetical protein APHWI1_1541 [Anaplasma phagocytophilum str. ApWI1]|uniref:Uncharacterized protein n=3 Tax=Anaplasma phagocytophilum TaxID=948 RepID=Q2GKK6_ANAPZ|nr:hypothetical protein APH_0497 [Anaplasma phagocytophilum str. HZ]KJV59912.1 hypothetical protein APHWEB_1555 [Anaplasma phagocytophilum str. Webster]KJV66110.1 hypothetical protein EPHNCH_0767 [Anaplasma phagocytophilum str. NCH-1]KJV82531.1 hypothetical protein APHHGE2_0760 [Anaplasma phagocytophilum str. HGE2]KJV84967.1 hypothetical protein APHWI1_1541 [Anaplasma phagocytophilum str. ApWI1]KJV87589.1 hypothetical protein APHNYW_0490 [Anaplasma phagocytophilum str. ApNYW]KJV99059.1 hypoth